MKEKVKLFVDMDGVLADFNTGFKEITGHTPQEFKDNVFGEDKKTEKELYQVFEILFWNTINSERYFWESLPVMADYLLLWNYVKKYDPVVFTLCPTKNFGFWKAKIGKRKWLDKNLNCDVDMIYDTLDEHDYTKDKKSHQCTGPNDVLIDDNKKNIKGWKKAGGIGILHTSAEKTIKKLQGLNL